MGKVVGCLGVVWSWFAWCSPVVAQGADSGIETLVVTARRLEESLPAELETYGSRLEVIDGEAIARGGYNDVTQALQALVPGLYLAPKNGAFDYVNAALQGSRNSEILWLVDGVRIGNRLYNTSSPLDAIPAHMVDRIEVLKGGQGLFYGTQAVAGVINVITRDFSAQRDGTLEAGLDTNAGEHLNGHVRNAVGSHAFVGYLSHDEADGFRPFRSRDYQPSATERERGYEVTTFGLKYAYAASDVMRISTSYQHNDGSLDFAYAEDVARALNERDEDIASVKVDWKPRNRMAFYVKAYLHDWDSNWTRIDNVLGSDGLPTGEVVTISDDAIWRFQDRGVNLLGEFDLTDRLTALVGYDFQKYDGRDDEFLIGQQSESVSAPFAQLRLNTDLLSGTSFAAGVRHNVPDDGREKTVWNASGRVGLSPQTFVRGQVGTSFRLPSAYELYVVDPCCETGNPNLAGEEGFNTEIGIGYASTRISAELIGFRRVVDDLIDIDFSLPAFPDGFLVNTDSEVEVLGGELVVSIRPTDELGLTFDYTHTRAELDESGDQIQDVPRDLFKIIADWTSRSGRFGFDAALNHVGEVFDSVAGVGRVEHGDYSVIDVSGFFFVDGGQRHRIGVRIENLLDEEYASQLRRTRRDADGSSYAAGTLGTPRTGHVTYTFRF